MRASAASALLRSRVSGVFRSWAMLSDTCRKPSFSFSMRPSIAFRDSESRSNSSPEPLVGSRCDRSPAMILVLASDMRSMRFSALRPMANQIMSAPRPMMPSATINAWRTRARNFCGSWRSRPTRMRRPLSSISTWASATWLSLRVSSV
ncbi:hypothetical protein D3C72_2036500 [compost metagenome]